MAADCTVAWTQIGERSGHAETGRNMWAAVRTHAFDRSINARLCIPEIILQAGCYPLAMLEVRDDEVNLESDRSSVHGSGHQHRHQSGNIGVVESPPTSPLLLTS